MLKHPAFRYTIAILIGATALYLAFHKQHWHTLRDEISGTNLWIIGAGTLVMFLSHLVRAWRYKMFLRPIAPHTRLFSAFRALVAGYAANNVIPRAGDVVRPVLFSKRENIPISSSVAVLLIERLTDLIGLTAILIASVLLFRDEIALQFPAIGDAALPIVSVLFLIFCSALMIIFSERKTAKVIHFIARTLPKRFEEAIENSAIRIEEGLRGVRYGSGLPVIAGTLGISALYTCSMYISSLAFPSTQLNHLGFVGCFLLQSMSGIAYILPSPGGTGTYHFLVSQSLAAIFGVPPEAAIAFATLTHASNYLCTTLVGFAFMTADGISVATVREEAPIVAQAIRVARETRAGAVPLEDSTSSATAP